MKKLVSLFLCGAMVCSLAACGQTTSKMENDASVIATINGESVTRGDVGESLKETEKQAILTYINSKLIDDFFADVEVTDTMVEAQIAAMKAQVGEEQWPMYLAYYGGGSEESFRDMMKKTLKQENYINAKMETLVITDEELQEIYDKNPNSFNIAVLDVVFFGEEAQLTAAKEKYAEGASLQDVATHFNTEVYQDEHTYFESDSLTWSKPLAECEVGEVVFSGENSGSLFMGVVKELNKGISNPTVKDDLIKSLKYEKAYSETDKEVGEYLKEQKVIIFGEETPLVEEESENIQTGVENSVTDATE